MLLAAEGVRASALSYTLQHKLPLYAEDQWWHHKPEIPDLPGSEKANATCLALPYFTTEAPELVDQYVKAFEKVWAHRKELAESWRFPGDLPRRLGALKADRP